MKCFIIMSLALLSGLEANLEAGPGTASLTLAGVIPSVLSMSMMAPAQGATATALRSLSTNPSVDVEIARLVEVNNTFGTYVLTVSSLNHGALQSDGSGSTPSLGYVLTYNDTPVDLQSGRSTLASGPRESGTTTTHVLRLRLQPDSKVSPAEIVSGRYTDVVTLSVAAP
jgi:hypothetical protein